MQITTPVQIHLTFEQRLISFTSCNCTCEAHLKKSLKVFVLGQVESGENTGGLLNSNSCFHILNTKPFLVVCVQSHQNEVEIFDENLAHISTWLYQTQIHLDEAERLAPTEREKVVKVRQRGLLYCVREKIKGERKRKGVWTLGMYCRRHFKHVR